MSSGTLRWTIVAFAISSTSNAPTATPMAERHAHRLVSPGPQ
jgi:hypothetical protein